MHWQLLSCPANLIRGATCLHLQKVQLMGGC